MAQIVLRKDVDRGVLGPYENKVVNVLVGLFS
jgi:hypothetical protein